MAKGVIIAGERSGVGKTSLTLALVQCFLNRGLKVQCFKVGPDFIDTGHHTAVSGRASRNLDGWMMGRPYCIDSYARQSRDADMAVVEGVMGLFDGYDGGSEDGSTAQMAKWLNLPVILVVDGSSFARSAGALVLGYETYDKDLHPAGVIFNNVAGERHFRYLADGMQDTCAAEVLGYVPRTGSWELPERHLGLVMAKEFSGLLEKINAMACHIEKTVQVSRVIELAQTPAAVLKDQTKKKPPSQKSTVIGVARDEAFCFYYQDNFELLEQAGAEIRFFSPLREQHLPTGVHGLYLGGGYPELHARQLSANESMRRAVQAFCASGRPVYAECGGLLYLLAALTDQQGVQHDMAGLFPATARMLPRLQRLGYVECAVLSGCPFAAQGERLRGHEFHYSEISDMPESVARCYSVMQRKNRPSFREGYTAGNVLASYIHLHFASNPSFAGGFTKKCREQTPWEGCA
jgi:cobyrinic acid a,c-diamide synthase